MITGIDIGTTSISGALYDPDSQRVIQCLSRVHGADRPGMASGAHEQCPDTLLACAARVLSELSAQSPEPVQAIALTGQMHGLTAVDRHLRPLTPLITWRDQRISDALLSEWRDHAWTEETGCRLHAGYGALTLRALLDANELPQDTHVVLPVEGWIAAQLTGRCAIDETLAASWGLWDVPHGQWHEPLIKALDLPRHLLPEVVPSCTPIGHAIHPERYALPKGARVYSPVGDNQAGVAGMANPDSAVINLGTSGQFSLPTDAYAYHPPLETRPFPGGRFMQVYASLCGGWAWHYLAGFYRQVIAHVTGQAPDIDTLLNIMNDWSEGDDGGLRADTRFAGERHGPVSAGRLSGIDTRNLTPEHLARAVADGMVRELAEAARALDLASVTEIVAAGHAAQHIPRIVPSIEEQFGKPCRLADTPEPAAVGAARLCTSSAAC